MSTDDRELANAAPDGNQSLPVTDLDPTSVGPHAADEVRGGVGGGVVNGYTGNTYTGNTYTGNTYTGNTLPSPR